MAELIRPFGPSIMIDDVSNELVDAVNNAADQIMGNPELSERFDWSHMLAGNVDREVRIAFRSSEERRAVEAELKEKCLLYYDFLKQNSSFMKVGSGTRTDIGPEDLEFRGLWVVSQLAGDFNPYHSHGGDFSSVLYLRLPAGLDAEWEAEDHSPSVGAIEFFDGRPSPYVRSAYLMRPRVGMIALFPSWLPHTVYPFRCEGERRSMSFNMAIRPQNKKKGQVASGPAMSAT